MKKIEVDSMNPRCSGIILSLGIEHEDGSYGTQTLPLENLLLSYQERIGRLEEKVDESSS